MADYYFMNILSFILKVSVFGEGDGQEIIDTSLFNFRGE